MRPGPFAGARLAHPLEFPWWEPAAVDPSGSASGGNVVRRNAGVAEASTFPTIRPPVYLGATVRMGLRSHAALPRRASSNVPPGPSESEGLGEGLRSRSSRSNGATRRGTLIFESGRGLFLEKGNLTLPM